MNFPTTGWLEISRSLGWGKDEFRAFDENPPFTASRWLPKAGSHGMLGT
jgi:hypothetical protein